MFNRRFMQIALVAIGALLSSTIALSGHAAGSGGGSMGTTPSKGDSDPQQMSEKAFRAGVRNRDRALKHEAKAARAKNDKAREKSLAKAQKQYQKAISKQGEAIKLHAQNFKAANELGFALRKTGDYRKAIGAYNYALEINPDFHEATEYRAEAFLALGLLEQTQQSYMQLFRTDRALADQLMSVIDAWVADKSDSLAPDEEEFIYWVNERKRLAKITADLTMNNERSW